MALTVDVSRVYHLSQRNVSTKKLGTVKKLFTKDGNAYARIQWDGEAKQVSHPVANLVEVA
jgi:hypothetical protein